MIWEIGGAPPSAMIALFALANAEGGIGPPAPLVRMSASQPPVSLQAAAEMLHALPKPLGLTGSVRDGVLTLSEDEELSAFARMRRDLSVSEHAARGDYGFLRARYGDAIDDLEVVCFSAGSYLRVRLADLREYEQSYFLDTAGNHGMDFADTAYPRAQGADRAPLVGAAAFVAFASRADVDHRSGS